MLNTATASAQCILLVISVTAHLLQYKPMFSLLLISNLQP